MVKEIKAEEFESVVINNTKACLVEFYGTWCMPCKMLAGILDNVSDKLSDKIDVVKLDVDENLELAKKYGVLTVPTLIVIKDGVELEKTVGFRQEKQVIELITKYIN